MSRPVSMMPQIPLFKKGSRPDQWLKMFEDAALFCTKGTEESKLKLVSLYLNEKNRDQFYDQEFQSWEEFKTEFIYKNTKRKDIKGAIKKLESIKQKKHKDLEDFIDRFDNLRRKQKKEAQTYEDTIQSLDDLTLCYLLIKAQNSKSMHHYIRHNDKPQTSKAAKKAVREYEDIKSDQDDSSKLESKDESSSTDNE